MLRTLILLGCVTLAFSRILTKPAQLPPLPFPGERIVGGHKTSIRNHPHQLTLQVYSSHSCGASIISRKWAVTAGHCAGNSPSAYRVGAGHTTRTEGTFFKVDKIIRHPKFNLGTVDYDVALIKIKGEFKYSENIQPIKLAQTEVTPGTNVNVTGWGATFQGGWVTSDLMEVNIPIVDRKVCQEAYGGVNTITNRMICAGHVEAGGKDSCQGDSGGPLSANGILYGIVSWGYGCAQPNYPGVYTNVAELRPWITNVTGI